MARRLDYQEPPPVWRIVLMTELFGTAGQKWGVDQVDWSFTSQKASVCVVVWWIDLETGERKITDLAWGSSSKIDTDCMSNAMDHAINSALCAVEGHLPFRTIPLSQGFSAVIDAADYDRVSKSIWSVSRAKWTNYACRAVKRGGKNVMIQMHREIMEPKEGQQVDHINHNGLDNRRQNLRLCSNCQNSRNTRSRPGTSVFKGVCFDKASRNWTAQITVNGKKKHLGNFREEVDAALAYDKAAKANFGAFSILNFKE